MSSHDDHDAFEGASLSARAMAARPMPYLDELNPAQREAVEALDGPVLMLAGAGTGKTKALTARIVHLLSTARAAPNEILAVTFTNKAAKEMKARVGRMLGEHVEGMPWLGTFHAICVKLLRRHAELVGLKSSFTILDTDDQIRLMKQLIRANNIDEKRWPARQLAGIIDNWKNRAWTPQNVPSAESAAFNNRGTELYDQYQRRLLELNAVDFGDLLLHVVTIFQKHEDVLAQYQRWFRYILVDEYQDTNVAQYLWLRLLAGGHRNICCVGDDDQSIYGWRGAEVGNILRFEKDFPGAKVVRLEQNYRSTEHILAAAGGVIRGNEGRLGKELWTEAGEGWKVRLIGHWDGEEEARWIGEKIEDHQSGRSEEAKNRYNPRLNSFQQELDRRAKSGLGPVDEHQYVRDAFESGSVYSDMKTFNLVKQLLDRDKYSARYGNMLGALGDYVVHRFSLDEIAILVRASHQMRAFEDRFLTIGLPYRVIGGPRFYERLEIRDAMAYFRLVVSPADDLAFERIVNTPKRGLGDKAQQKIQVCARDNGVPLVEGARILLAEGGIGGKGAGELRALIDNLDRWGRMTGHADLSHVELAEQVLDESGYTAMWQNDKTPEAPGRLENLKELVKALENFDNLQGFLEHVSLIMDNASEDQGAKVSIMTLHAAKGLEFPAVFLPGWEDGLFPSQRSMDESGPKGLEEERRLAYVGITRAEEVCTISFAGNRRVFGQWQSQIPSRFIDELPGEHVEVLTPPGLYGGGFGAAAPGYDGIQSTVDKRASEANVYNSPGWKRMQARAGQRPMSQPRETRSQVIDLEAVSRYTIGDRVFHQKFGYGAITGIEGDKLDIDFEKAGTKKVVAKFVMAGDDVPF
ncbi:Putative uvrD/DNA Helicase II [Pseudooceanicola batsensis HTCC2597]|uniref:DNA 3'-5' helicase n=1 Tax=Pseudooceanicola batsensis (strain ATCC BAA-863 / DSM 15984 / KCTC 12145 / HTCC2597) TaxID=252305 RepID=A3TZA4_PSEBH|nr:UvrD-helicase domain-containing protein [Pseudooceanicola batsensis]EAQ02922.1 Putative uvrD/DNA Helicase II [Pseudooceanicola batsensis HTCC2597]